MVDEHDVIDIEVVDERLDETAPKPSKPKKINSDKRKQILFWGNIMRVCLRHGMTIAIFGGVAGLANAIVYGELGNAFQFVLMIIGFSLCGIGFLMFGFGLIARAIMLHYMRLDPNYADQI